MTSAGDTRETIFRFRYAKGELLALCNSSIKKMDDTVNEIVKNPSSKGLSSLLRYENAVANFMEEQFPLQQLYAFSPDAELRKDSQECEKRASLFAVELSTRKDLYAVLKKSKVSGPDEKVLYRETILAFERNGLHLPDDQLAVVKKLKAELSALSTDFASNLNADKTVVDFTKDELEGVPASYFANFEVKEGRVFVPLNGANYSAIIENAKRSATRRKLALAWDSRAASANMPLITRAVALRAEIAKRMGYKTWADYRIQGRMAKSSAEVMGFLNGLRTKVAQANRRRVDRMRALKKVWEPQDPELHAWDLKYYDENLKRQDFAYDAEKIREYFPADPTIDAIFGIYSQLLGIDIVEMKDVDVWAPGVKLYKISNHGKGDTVGWFFMDLYPREGKYGHAAAFPFRMGREKDGSYVKPISAIAANFQPPGGGRPALLSQDDVETFFHEFGHIVHQVLTRAKYASLSGTSVAEDFVEAPSQMLENWVWDPKILSQISSHYLRPSEKLPQDQLINLLKSRDAGKGYFYTRQLIFALYDMQIHTASGVVDPKAVYLKVFRDLSGIEPMKEGFFPATFSHSMGGYDAGYYGYTWSEAFSHEMFTRFQKEGLLNPKTGASYRKNILETGKMVDTKESLRRFLGQAPSTKGFLKYIDSLQN